MQPRMNGKDIELNGLISLKKICVKCPKIKLQMGSLRNLRPAFECHSELGCEAQFRKAFPLECRSDFGCKALRSKITINIVSHLFLSYPIAKVQQQGEGIFTNFRCLYFKNYSFLPKSRNEFSYLVAQSSKIKFYKNRKGSVFGTTRKHSNPNLKP